MKRLITALVAALTLVIGSAISAPAAMAQWRVTGTDQTGTTVVLYCNGDGNPRSCHSVYGGEPRTIHGGLSKQKQVARGFTWAYVGPVDVTCVADDADLACGW